MNTPNKLTLLRILLVPFFIFFLLNTYIKHNFFWSLLTFLFAALTDHLDGKLARKNNQITDFGKFLDPLADKILVLSAFICFVELNLISSIPVVIILSRELIITSIRLISTDKNRNISANKWGKFKTTSQMITIIYILFLGEVYKNLNIGINTESLLNYFNKTLICFTIILTIFSGIVYIKENLDLIKLSK